MTRVIEVDDKGSLAIPADLLGDPEPHARYVVEARGRRLTVAPAEPQRTRRPRRRDDEGEEWERERARLADELAAVWPEGVSVADALAEMRR